MTMNSRAVFVHDMDRRGTYSGLVAEKSKMRVRPSLMLRFE
jgi:hypothetical protein